MVLNDLATILNHLGALPAQDPPPGLDPTWEPMPGLVDVAPKFLGWLKWLLLFCGVAGLLICGIQMAVGRRNRSAFAAEGAAGIPWVFGGLSLGMVAASIVTGIFFPSS